MQVAVGEDDETAVLLTGVFAGLFFTDQRVDPDAGCGFPPGHSGSSIGDEDGQAAQPEFDRHRQQPTTQVPLGKLPEAALLRQWGAKHPAASPSTKYSSQPEESTEFSCGEIRP